MTVNSRYSINIIICVYFSQKDIIPIITMNGTFKYHTFLEKNISSKIVLAKSLLLLLISFEAILNGTMELALDIISANHFCPRGENFKEQNNSPL